MISNKKETKRENTKKRAEIVHFFTFLDNDTIEES